MPPTDAFWPWLLHELQRPLVLFGFAGQFVFFLRFAVQWFVSERRGKSHIPIAFWYLSLVGGLMTFVYALLEKNLVFTTAQGLGVFIYIRNLMLIYRRQARLRERRQRGLPVVSDDDALQEGAAVPPAGS